MDENTQAMYEQYMNDIRDMQTMNNNWSAEQAQIAREYEERMSNSAHQREMEDLKKAGLNPVLAAGGSGATTTSGNAAQRGDSNIASMASLMSKMLDASMAQASASYGSAQAVADAVENIEKDKTGDAVLGGFAESGVSKGDSKGPMTFSQILNDPIIQRNEQGYIQNLITELNKDGGNIFIRKQVSRGHPGKNLVYTRENDYSKEQIRQDIADAKMNILLGWVPSRMRSAIRKYISSIPVVNDLFNAVSGGEAWVISELSDLIQRLYRR